MAAISGYEKSATRYALKTARWERTAYYRRTELLAPLLTLPGIATDSILVYPGCPCCRRASITEGWVPSAC